MIFFARTDQQEFLFQVYMQSISDLLVENFKMRYKEYSVKATHTRSSVILFVVAVWHALEDVTIEICAWWLDFVEVFRNRNFRCNLCLFYQNFVSLCIAWNLSDAFRSSHRVIHAKQPVIIPFQHHNSIITWYVTNWPMILELTCETRKFHATYVTHLWQIQWNLDFTFLDSTFSLVLRKFYRFQRICVRGTLCIPWINFVLLTHFLDFTFKFSPIDINLSIFFILNQERKLIFGYNILPPILSSYRFATCQHFEMLCAFPARYSVVSWSHQRSEALHHTWEVAASYWCEACVVEDIWWQLMLHFELTINWNGQQFYLPTSFLVKIGFSDRMKFHVDDNIAAVLSSSEKEVYRFQQKAKERQFTLINMCKKWTISHILKHLIDLDSML